jgi:serine/threonine-protein kinase
MTDGLLQPAAGPDPKIGMVLQDRYRIVRKLGEGGMGAVYEGEHVLIKRRVAIKCLHGQFATNPEIVARFHREALAATSIGHQNIIEVTDMGRFPDGSVFMVLEFLEGRDWSKDIDEQGPQPLGKVVKITSQICDALTAAHAKGIVHRDLKPENVFLIARGHDPDFVKVLDFGISKFRDSNSGPGKAMTQTGTTLGTPYYMAPEQAQGKKDIDHRADIYSLGVMTFQALTGQYPFDDESYPMLVLKICTEPPPPLRLYRPDLPKELEDLVMRMLAKDPAQRFADCAAVKAALAPFASMNDAPVVAADAPSTANRPPSMLGGQAIGHGATQTPDSLPAAPALKATTPSQMPVAQVPIAQTPVAAHAESVIRPPTTSRTPLLVGGVLVLALLGGGAAIVLGGGGEETPVVQPTAVATLTPSPDPTPPDPTPTEPTPMLEPTSAETLVAITIRTEPADAELYLDGDRIPNPFEGRLPQTTEPRRLEARKEGFRSLVQELVLRYEQTVTLRMERGRGTDDRRRSTQTTVAAVMTTEMQAEVAPTMEPAMVEVAVTPMEEPPPAMDPEPVVTMDPPRMTDLASIML